MAEKPNARTAEVAPGHLETCIHSDNTFDSPSKPTQFVVPHPLAKTLGSLQLAKYARAGSCGFRLRRPRSIAIQEHHLRVQLAGTHQRSAHTVEVQAADRLHGLVCKHVSITPAAEYPITHFNIILDLEGSG